MDKTFYEIFNEKEKRVLERASEEFRQLIGRDDFNWDHFVIDDCKESTYVVDELDESNPSDLLVVTQTLYDKFQGMLEEFGLDERMGVPSDIFNANTIPIKDCLIEVELPDQDNLEYRVVILDRPDLLNGYLIYQEGNAVMVWPLIYSEVFGTPDTVSISPVKVFTPGPDNTGYLMMENAKNFAPAFLTNFYIAVDLMLKMWYSFQICLLNPEMKETLMKKTGKEKLDGRCLTKKKDERRKAKYVKRHRVESDIFQTSTDGSVERKTLCWYVIGHWRNYSNGKKTFVKPYWKGPLRHMERNLDQGRERIL